MPQDGAAPVLDGPAAAVFAVPHGMGDGILSIAKRSLPLAVFGPVGFGAWQGLLAAPARLPQAAAPFAFGLLLKISGGSRRVDAHLRAVGCRWPGSVGDLPGGSGRKNGWSRLARLNISVILDAWT